MQRPPGPRAPSPSCRRPPPPPPEITHWLLAPRAQAPLPGLLLCPGPAATAAHAVPAAGAATAENVIDGQGQTFLEPFSAVENFTAAQKQILEYNLRTQRQNNRPPDFPAFVREGYDMTGGLPGL